MEDWLVRGFCERYAYQTRHGTELGGDLVLGEMTARIAKDKAQMLANLTATQARCTELLQELRVLKSAVDIIAPDPLEWSDAMGIAEERWRQP